MMIDNQNQFDAPPSATLDSYSLLNTQVWINLAVSVRFKKLQLNLCHRSLIKFMSAPEQPYLPMSVSNDVVKRAASDGSSSYQSSKEFAEQVLEPIRDIAIPNSFANKE